MALIDVKGVTKVFGEGESATHALRGIDLQIERGEFVAIMGPSGSGKSTLLHILGFLDHHTGGDYLFDGKSMGDYSEDELARVRNKKMGFVFQAFNLLGRASVLDNVKLPLLYSGIAEKQWDDLAQKRIKEVGLGHRLEHTPAKLSGGEKQRVAIARALVANPNVIFADEPTGNLDSKSGKIIMETIQRLNEVEGRTVILITHETYTAEHAKRIIELRDGKIYRDSEVTHHREAAKEFKK
jgi:putative ABC transport system ATP-binding protein